MEEVGRAQGGSEVSRKTRGGVKKHRKDTRRREGGVRKDTERARNLRGAPRSGARGGKKVKRLGQDE